jgi:hypothetical protein
MMAPVGDIPMLGAFLKTRRSRLVALVLFSALLTAGLILLVAQA